MENNVWLTLEEVSEYLCFSKEKIYLLLRKNNIPAVKVGRHWRFNRKQIDDWMVSLSDNLKHQPARYSLRSKFEEYLGIFQTAQDFDVKIHEELIEPKMRDDLWQVYHYTFNQRKEVAAQDQRSYDERSFKKALVDPEYVKFILTKDNYIGGFSLATHNLDKARIVYMNPEFFKSRYPRFAQERRIYYVTALSVLPEIRGSKGIKELLTSMVHFINKNEAVVAFDFSENKNQFLPSLIQALAGKLNIPVVGNKLDSQTYYEIYGQNNKKPE